MIYQQPTVCEKQDLLKRETLVSNISLFFAPQAIQQRTPQATQQRTPQATEQIFSGNHRNQNKQAFRQNI